MLGAARVVGTLAEALEGCGFVAATTSRDRDQYFRVQDVREAAPRIVAQAQRSPAAVLFGAERTGLTNEELETAHVLIRIPATTPTLRSISPWRCSWSPTSCFGRAAYASRRRRPVAAPLASAADMQRLYEHFAQVLEEIDFRDRTQSGTHLMLRIRRFLQRAELDENEVNILRGILTAVQNRRRAAGERR